MAQKKIRDYTHKGKKRLNNPPAGLATSEPLPQKPERRVYSYDPHLDPQLEWAGKTEHTSFEVPTVSLHVHERIEPATIIESVKKDDSLDSGHPSLFDSPEENLPLRKAVEFYRHRKGWSNRLIAGDSLLVMNSLLEKEGYGESVQMIYMDPPYGIKYGSNCQPFTNKREVQDKRDEDLTQEPEMIRAFRDTWELGIHSYLTYLRDRLVLARALLHESGSCFVQISEDNLHLVRILMDEVFGKDNFSGLITYKTTSGVQQRNTIRRTSDYLLWYAKDHQKIKFNRLYGKISIDTRTFGRVEDSRDGTRRRMTSTEKRNPDKIEAHLRPFRTLPLHSKGAGDRTPREFQGEKWGIPRDRHWSYALDGFNRLCAAGRIVPEATALGVIYYIDDFGYAEITNNWTDTGPELHKSYVVQTSPEPIQRCMLMCTDPGDLVLDPTCGSGTTAYVAERWGRRWVTCDTSRVALAVARQRLMTATFDYYTPVSPDGDVGSGLKYKTVPKISLESIAKNEKIIKGLTRQEINRIIRENASPVALYDFPLIDPSVSRVTGPFTYEAVPSASVRPIRTAEVVPPRADSHIARDSETARQADWRSELLKTGVRGKSGQHLSFSRVETLPGTRWLHADGEFTPPPPPKSSPASPARVVVSFGPAHAPLGQDQVLRAIKEAEKLVPSPAIVLFAAFHFDPEAAKNIDETHWPEVTLLRAQMNADLLTADLKKKRANNQSFWLVGQPDVRVEKIETGEDQGRYTATVQGFDYYDTVAGIVESGGPDKVAMWMLDPDYDGYSVFPRQVFFPLDGRRGGWIKLAKSLKSTIDENLVALLQGVTSLPFESGKHRRAAVKIIDTRGIESLKIIDLDP